jgi:hypothetical protein
VSHVAWLDGYFLANDVGTYRFHWSDADDPFAWDALSFASAEGHWDDLMALHVAWLEIVLFGRDSVESFYDDGVTPFSRIDGGVLERGVLAPWTIRNVEGTWVWLDNTRRVAVLQGRTYRNVSGPYDSIINDIDDVSEAYAIHFTLRGHTFYAISFPTVSRSFVWNMTNDTWYEWGIWDSSTGTYGLYLGKSYAYARSWDTHFVGSSAANGRVYRLNPALYQEDTAEIRTLMWTSHISHGTSAKKRTRRLRFNVKRGQGTVGGTEPVFTMRYRDNNRSWGNERQIGLGDIGEYPNIVEVRHLGTYKTRQYEFVHSDNSDFILNAIEEDVEPLE